MSNNPIHSSLPSFPKRFVEIPTDTDISIHVSVEYLDRAINGGVYGAEFEQISRLLDSRWSDLWPA